MSFPLANEAQHYWRTKTRTPAAVSCRVTQLSLRLNESVAASGNWGKRGNCRDWTVERIRAVGAPSHIHSCRVDLSSGIFYLDETLHFSLIERCSVTTSLTCNDLCFTPYPSCLLLRLLFLLLLSFSLIGPWEPFSPLVEITAKPLRQDTQGIRAPEDRHRTGDKSHCGIQLTTLINISHWSDCEACSGTRA